MALGFLGSALQNLYIFAVRVIVSALPNNGSWSLDVLVFGVPFLLLLAAACYYPTELVYNSSGPFPIHGLTGLREHLVLNFVSKLHTITCTFRQKITIFWCFVHAAGSI